MPARHGEFPARAPLDIREQCETQLKDRQACGEAILELRARTKLQALTHSIPPRHDARFIKVLDGDMPRWRSVRDECNRDPLAARDTARQRTCGAKKGGGRQIGRTRGCMSTRLHAVAEAQRSVRRPGHAAPRHADRTAERRKSGSLRGLERGIRKRFLRRIGFGMVVAPDRPAVGDRAAGNISP